MRIPAHLVTTVELLSKAFPAGISQGDYLAVLAVLYPFMADEALAEVASLLTGRERGAALNDVLAAGEGFGIPVETLAAVTAKLREAGLERWSSEE